MRRLIFFLFFLVLSTPLCPHSSTIWCSKADVSWSAVRTAFIENTAPKKIIELALVKVLHESQL
jgi:hypothetical protein